LTGAGFLSPASMNSARARGRASTSRDVGNAQGHFRENQGIVSPANSNPAAGIETTHFPAAPREACRPRRSHCLVPEKTPGSSRSRATVMRRTAVRPRLQFHARKPCNLTAGPLGGRRCRGPYGTLAGFHHAGLGQLTFKSRRTVFSTRPLVNGLQASLPSLPADFIIGNCRRSSRHLPGNADLFAFGLRAHGLCRWEALLPGPSAPSGSRNRSRPSRPHRLGTAILAKGRQPCGESWSPNSSKFKLTGTTSPLDSFLRRGASRGGFQKPPAEIHEWKPARAETHKCENLQL
jgi:hypothetical protein